MDGTGEWWIPLPGATGINICYREAAFPAWSSDGTKIEISLSPCTDQPSTDSNSGEFDVGEVDVATFRGTESAPEGR